MSGAVIYGPYDRNPAIGVVSELPATQSCGCCKEPSTKWVRCSVCKEQTCEACALVYVEGGSETATCVRCVLSQVDVINSDHSALDRHKTALLNFRFEYSKTRAVPASLCHEPIYFPFLSEAKN